MDETCIKVKGTWAYLYRAIDRDGQTLDFMLSETCDEDAATAFFARTIRNNGWPDQAVPTMPGLKTSTCFCSCTVGVG
ncbi:MAG: DDE-type integrase/transposase/recombinase [Rhodobacteraceae bacterium]|nr:DDE-type integrase/transposase/recombinase [Paracoccaceae bacterium]